MLLKRLHARNIPVSSRLVIVEVFFIIFGVVLALGANEWRKSIDNRARAENALVYIRDEIRRNRIEVDSVVSYHTRIRDALTAIRTEAMQGQRPITYMDLRTAMPEGFTTPLLESTGWDMANSTGLVDYLDYQLAIDIAQVYRLQAFYEEKLARVADNIYVAGNIDLQDLSATTVAFSFLAGDLVILEHTLSKRYGELLAHLPER